MSSPPRTFPARVVGRLVQHRNVALLLATFLSGACSFGSDPAPPTATAVPISSSEAPLLTSGTVTKVLDGVTVEVIIDGSAVNVRYLGIEVPQSDDLGAVDPTVAERARDFNRFLVLGKQIELERDSRNVDTFGRTLRYVYVNGEMVNQTMVTNGYAVVASSPSHFRHKTALAIAEEKARLEKRGYWEAGLSTGDPTPPAKTPEFTGGTLPAPPGSQSTTGICDYSGTDQAVIKGNVDARTGERLYHLPGSLFYATTQVSEADGDQWLCTEAEALAAGWKKSKR